MHHNDKQPTDKSTVQAITRTSQWYSGSNQYIVYGKVLGSPDYLIEHYEKTVSALLSN
jgi:hypothetical protein